MLFHIYYANVSIDLSCQSKYQIHTVVAGQHAVDTQPGVLLLNLARLDRRKCLDRAQTRILGQCQGHGIQRIRKGTHSVLFDAGALKLHESVCCNKTWIPRLLTFTAASSTAREQAISAAPPPYTTRLSLTRFRTTQRASCSERLASSMI